MRPARSVMYGISSPRWWVVLRGRSRLRFRVCPMCYSSPPRPSCPVCDGSYDYSYRASESQIRVWRSRWQHYLNNH